MKKGTKERIENERRWREHLAGAAKYPGTRAAYCEAHGISQFAMAYWRKKVEGSRGRRTREMTPRTAFIPVQVLPTLVETRFPDPKWVAEFVRNLLSLEGAGR